MRRGDCCLLKWDDVDLKAGFITVKTAKTGETVDIPVFPMLREELERARAATGGKGFCFPAAAEMYRNNPDGITWRVKQVLAKALEGAADRGSASAGRGRSGPRAWPTSTASATRSKAAKMRAVFTAYMDGQTLDEVMAATGCSRGAVSGYLNEIERETGCADRPRQAPGAEDRRAAGRAGERQAPGVGPRLPQLPRHVDHARPRRRRAARTGPARHRPPDRRGRDEALLPAGAGGLPGGDLQGDAEDAGRWRAAVGEGGDAGRSSRG